MQRFGARNSTVWPESARKSLGQVSCLIILVAGKRDERARAKREMNSAGRSVCGGLTACCVNSVRSGIFCSAEWRASSRASSTSVFSKTTPHAVWISSTIFSSFFPESLHTLVLYSMSRVAYSRSRAERAFAHPSARVALSPCSHTHRWAARRPTVRRMQLRQ